MTLNSTRRAVLLGALAAGAAGPALAISPSDFPDAEVWDMLGGTEISTDARTGQYSARFPAEVTKLAGRTFEITGFILPLQAARQTSHFVLSRYPADCPFCNPGDPNQVIEVYSRAPVNNIPHQATVKGVFSVLDPKEGVFFKLANAEVQVH